MAQYTLQFQYSPDGGTWLPCDEAFDIESTLDLQEIAVADDEPEDLPPGAIWRLGVWNGWQADTSRPPVAESGPWQAENQSADEMLAELEEVQARRLADEERRDLLVRHLMQTDVRRARIAEAAGVKEARLYQIAEPEVADRGLIRRALRVMHPGVPARVSSRNHAVLDASLEDLARQLVEAAESLNASLLDPGSRALVRRAIARAAKIAT